MPAFSHTARMVQAGGIAQVPGLPGRHSGRSSGSGSCLFISQTPPHFLRVSLLICKCGKEAELQRVGVVRLGIHRRAQESPGPGPKHPPWQTLGHMSVSVLTSGKWG